MAFKDYKVFSDNKLENLTGSVQGAMAQGWQPLGNVSVVHTSLDENEEVSSKGKPQLIYLQAVVR